MLTFEELAQFFRVSDAWAAVRDPGSLASNEIAQAVKVVAGLPRHGVLDAPGFLKQRVHALILP